MHYLKCDNCGYLNPIRSEYVTFCDHCGRKLKYNFSDWKVANPEGDFGRFKEEVGITGAKADTERRAFKRRISPQTRKVLVIASAIIICVVAGAFATQFGRRVARSFVETRAPVEWLSSSWQNFTPSPGSNISLQTPTALTVYQQTLPGATADKLTSLHAYRNKDSDGLKINIIAAEYMDSLMADPDMTAKSAMEEMKAQKDYSQFDYSQHPVTINGRPAILQEGSYVYKSSTALQFRNLIIANGSEICRILVTYGAADDAGNQVAEKVIQSVRIKD